jgi:hypothetical protein
MPIEYTSKGHVKSRIMLDFEVSFRDFFGTEIGFNVLDDEKLPKKYDKTIF